MVLTVTPAFVARPIRVHLAEVESSVTFCGKPVTGRGTQAPEYIANHSGCCRACSRRYLTLSAKEA